MFLPVEAIEGETLFLLLFTSSLLCRRHRFFFFLALVPFGNS
jgi:hypothetical protein